MKNTLRQYWLVFAGTGLALVTVTAGVTVAVMTLKREKSQFRRDVPPLTGATTGAGADSMPCPGTRPSLAPCPPQTDIETNPLPPKSQFLIAISEGLPRRSILAPKEPAAKPPMADHTCGTKIQFQTSPTAACKKALAEDKLVFILHVSGNFEDPQFT